jgi:hypothetical protein
MARHRETVGAYVACAHEDMPMARTLYQGLWAHGLDLQLQLRNFLVGHSPDQLTARAIGAAAVIVFYISQNSYDTSGHLKYELQFINSLSDEKPVIGVIGDHSSVPVELTHVSEWIRLSDARAYELLTETLLALKNSNSLDLSATSLSRLAPLQAFISYSHKDEQYREELLAHLSSLRREGLIDIWHDRRIHPGSSIDDTIAEKLSRANIILLIVSPDFIASDYCYSNEMLKAMRRHTSGECIVVPILVRPVDWRRTPFGGLLALPKDGKAVSTWEHRDEAYVDVVAGIRRLLESELHVEGEFF